MKFSKNKIALTVIGIVFLIALAIGIFGFNVVGNETNTSKYDNFARCLTENGVKMYGAYWCSHCNNQKQMFDDSWKYINYVECSLPNGAGQTQICKQAGITGYPTWEFQDGKRAEGELSLELLSQYSNCKLEK
jgi:hypothetical protein